MGRAALPPHLTLFIMHYHNLLVAQRKANALTPEEVGDLLGRSADSIARYENGSNVPPLPIALRLQFLYGMAVSDLLPETFIKAVKDTVPLIQRLSIAVEGRNDAAAHRKRQFIKTLSDRLDRIIPDA